MTPDRQRQENTPAENRLVDAGHGVKPSEPAELPATLGGLTAGEGEDETQVDVATE